MLVSGKDSKLLGWCRMLVLPLVTHTFLPNNPHCYTNEGMFDLQHTKSAAKTTSTCCFYYLGSML